MSNVSTAALFVLGLVSLVPITSIAVDMANESYENRVRVAEMNRVQSAEKASRLEFERTCEWVTVIGGATGNGQGLSWVGQESRAKAGVSHAQGLKVCGQSAFNQGGEVRVAPPPGSQPSLALGSSARERMTE